jgi:anti-sigma factor RsiW
MKTPHVHIDHERMQALLDGDLSPADAGDVRTSIDACARCTAEFEAWQMLFEDLGDLPSLAPSAAFRERVLEQVPAVRPGLLGSRVRSRAAARAARTHVEGTVLQDYLDGRLAARNEARVDRHLDACSICRSELEAFRSVALAVESLPALAPSADFAERVMAEVRINQIAAVAMAPTTTTGRLVGWMRDRMPSSRQGWAAALGVSVVPVFTLILVVRSVFAHELVTMSNLAAFVRLQTSGLFASAGQAFSAVVARWAPAFMLDGAAWVGSSPTLIAFSVAFVSVATMASAWVLYRNLFRTPFDELSDARLSF